MDDTEDLADYGVDIVRSSPNDNKYRYLPTIYCIVSIVVSDIFQHVEPAHI